MLSLIYLQVVWSPRPALYATPPALYATLPALYDADALESNTRRNFIQSSLMGNFIQF